MFWLNWSLRGIAALGGALSTVAATGAISPLVGGIAGAIGTAAGVMAGSPLPGMPAKTGKAAPPADPGAQQEGNG